MEFTVGDTKDLLSWQCCKHGDIRCKGVLLSDDLTLGFVFLYLWRTEELMELEVTQ